MEFTLSGYQKLIEYLKRVYEISPLGAFPKKSTHCLTLRHDIDFSLESALKMAKLEKELDVRSTYFVLCHHRFYELDRHPNPEILKMISQLGHEIGLHYCPSEYRSRSADINSIFKNEIELIEHLVGRKVVSIARHGPWDRDPFVAAKGYLNANNPRIQGGLFVHDSCRVWNTFDGLLTLLANPPRKVQLLTHPENWTDEKTSRETLYNNYFGNPDREHQTLDEAAKMRAKYWFEDPSILEYQEKTANISDLSLSLVRSQCAPDLGKNKFQELRTIAAWYLINTRLGWKFHRIAETMKNGKN